MRSQTRDRQRCIGRFVKWLHTDDATFVVRKRVWMNRLRVFKANALLRIALDRGAEHFAQRAIADRVNAWRISRSKNFAHPLSERSFKRVFHQSATACAVAVVIDHRRSR